MFQVTISLAGEVLGRFIETSVDDALSLRDFYRLSGFDALIVHV